MNLLELFKDLNLNLDLELLTNIAKKSALIGTGIIDKNYKKIQNISSKGTKGDLVTNVDLEVEKEIKKYLLEKTPKISILVVTKGPVAIAGSMSNFLSINGVNAPIPAAMIIEQQILNPITIPRNGSALIN